MSVEITTVLWIEKDDGDNLVRARGRYSLPFRLALIGLREDCE